MYPVVTALQPLAPGSGPASSGRYCSAAEVFYCIKHLQNAASWRQDYRVSQWLDGTMRWF